jgi:predicted phosphoribosyltransferase
VIAAPVAAPVVARRLRAECNDAVFLDTPTSFSAVGHFFRDFEPVPDEEVGRLLESGNLML